MSSDAELSDALPDATTIEKTLRQIVQDGKVEPLTVNTVRAAAEEQLGLESGFLRNDEWKSRSKDVIANAFDEPSSQKSPSPSPQKASRKKTPAPAKPTKRASTEKVQKTRKRQKRATSESDVSEVEEPVPASKKATRTKRRAARQSFVSSDSEAEVDKAESGDEASEKSEQKENVRPEPKDNGVKAEAESESEMSVVLDEEPPKKRRGKSASADTKNKPKAQAAKAAKGGKASKASGNASKDLDPDEAEIKRLQGWLVKCGIRKLWHRELASYDSPKAKIKHLKDMLKDAGMEGRYSVEKARAIKEQRELAADLEAVQEGAKKWGHEKEAGSSEEEVETKPRRRAAAAARFVDFGDEDEDEDDE